MIPDTVRGLQRASHCADKKNVQLSPGSPLNTPRYITRYEQVSHIPEIDEEEFCPVRERYAFRTNSYYLSLINWDDKQDPIYRIIMPDARELYEWGKLDASDEQHYLKVPGLEHKYADTALLLVTDVCGGYCRFCFRKRLFIQGNNEAVRDVSQGIDYIRRHRELTNVLLTGGDPLILSTERLGRIIHKIREIDHINIIRIGSKMPAFNPFRILNDPSLLALFKNYSLSNKRIYLMTHFNHPNELTQEALESVNMLISAGVIVANQTPMLKGINDRPEVLADLMKKLSFAGIPSYYIFQGRPTAGNFHFAVPLERALEIFKEAQKSCAGLAKRARLVMSHATGKIEVLGKKDGKVFFSYLRSPDPDLVGQMFAFKSNPEAIWFDGYTEK